MTRKIIASTEKHKTQKIDKTNTCIGLATKDHRINKHVKAMESEPNKYNTREQGKCAIAKKVENRKREITNRLEPPLLLLI